MRRPIPLVPVLLIGCVLGLLAPLFAPAAALDGPVGIAQTRPATASDRVTTQDARLSVTLAANVSVADSGDSIGLAANVTNVGSEAALNIRLDAPLDVNATYVSSSPPPHMTAPPGPYDGRSPRWGSGRAST